MLYEDLLAGKERLSVIGLGYVGMPIAVAFAKVLAVIGYDNNAEKIKAYQEGRDPTQEIGDAAIQKSTMLFTSDAAELKKARFHIVAVPTPVNDDHTPNLSPVISASEAVGKNLMPGSIVVYEFIRASQKKSAFRFSSGRPDLWRERSSRSAILPSESIRGIKSIGWKIS